MSTRTVCLIAMSVQLFSQEPKATFGTTVVVPFGLEGRLYKIGDRTKRLPNFKRMKAVGMIYAKSLNVPPADFREGFPGVTDRFEWFAIDYRGRFWVENAGDYGFTLLSDDGSNLYVDGRIVIDNDGVHAPRERPGEVHLDRGVHEIRVSYFQGPRFHVALVLKVARPGEELRIFNTDEWKPPPEP